MGRLLPVVLVLLPSVADAGDAKASDVQVHVVGPGRKPAKDVEVAVAVKAWPGGAFRVVRRDAKTNAKGFATFADVVPPGTRFGVYAAVVQPGTTLSAHYVWSSTPASIPTFELAVAPATELSVRIVDGNGKPVGGVAVGPTMRSDASGQRHTIFGDPLESTVTSSSSDGIAKLSCFLPGEWVGVAIRPIGGDWETRELLVPTATGGVVDIPLTAPKTPDRELTAGGDAVKRVFLTGPKAGDVEPASGFGVVLVLPGGDGGDGFRTWVRERYDEWVDAGWVWAQLVAPVWESGPDRIVWPIEKSNVNTARFTTEAFVESAVAEIEKSVKIDRRRVLAVSWSSSGPACWRMLSMKKSPITGHLIAMSVFHPADLEPLANAKGRSLFLLHSPADETCPVAQAERGRDAAKKAGLDVEWATYEGGHGWAGESEAAARRALHWLASRVK